MTGKNWLVWYWLLHKRLLKKACFLLILCAIPVIVLLWAQLSTREQGLVRVAAAPETIWEEASLSAVDRLKGGSLIQVRLCQTAAEARELVAVGEAETAWIFQPELADRLARAGRGETVTLVRVILQEENIFGSAVREKLYGALFGEISYSMFDSFVREELGEKTTPAEPLRSIYDAYDYPQGLVHFVFLDSQSDPLENASLLLSPLRGILSLILLLAGMAAALYAKQDEKQQVFAMLPPKKRVLPLLGTVWSAVSVTALVLFGALVLSGVGTRPAREALMLLLLALCVTGFCCLLAALLPGERALGAALPLVLVAAAAFCPVFVNVRSFPWISVLLPPWYYLYGMGAAGYAWGAALYAAVTLSTACAVYPRLRC